MYMLWNGTRGLLMPEKTAFFIMGEFYRAKNKNKAAYYYSMAFRRGYEPAYTRLRQL